MRNHLLNIRGLVHGLQSQLAELVHPQALGCPLSEPRHKSFLAGCFASGATALLVLPLHLALIGPTSLPVALALAWMLAQLPLALFLSQTGKLETAHALSAAVFALFLGGICLLTGGLGSFALIWLAVVPMEAALSGSRKVIVGAIGLVAAVLVALAAVGPLTSFFAAPMSAATFFAAFTACIYMAVLAWRLAIDQKRARAALRDSNARVKLLNEAATSLLCVMEEDGSLRAIGGSCEGILGVSPRQARGNWLFQRVHVADRPLYLTRLADARSGAAVEAFEVRLRKGPNAPGDQGSAEFIWAELQFRHGDAQINLTIQDISARKRRDEALDRARATAEEASLSKTRFIASASHELRTPLNAIIGFSDMMRAAPEDGMTPARSREYAELIHQSGQHLLQVVDDILDTSRIETGHMDLSIEPVDLGACLESCRAMMVPIADAAGVALSFPDPAGLPMLPADRRALKQIVINLVSNAIKFSSEGSTVRVGVKRDGCFQVLEVKDEGKGIPEAMIDRLGQPFTRVHAMEETASAQGLQGSGLGLSIVNGLAELHGGAMSVESEAGKGTTVSVRLPAGSLKEAGMAEALEGLRGVAARPPVRTERSALARSA
ncbi:sensor histidine kinase [Roseibium sp.]|uniref:sensor histidine kinase n=1 Tax=Roseibium sp. TaxID=1936156 RepID=UPI003A970626